MNKEGPSPIMTRWCGQGTRNWRRDTIRWPGALLAMRERDQAVPPLGQASTGPAASPLPPLAKPSLPTAACRAPAVSAPGIREQAPASGWRAPAPHVVSREEVFAFLRRFGRNTQSFVLAYGGCDWFQSADPPGLVAYVRSGHTCVVGGDPLCDPEDAPAVLQAFARSIARGRRIAIVLASSWTVPQLNLLGYGAIAVGSDPFFDLEAWRPRGERGQRIRSAPNRARRRGVTVSSYQPTKGRDPRAEAELQACLRAWLTARPGLMVRFFSAVQPLEWPEEKRYFCAWQGGHMVAFVVCSPIYARHSWLIADIVRRPDTVHGATEWLITTAFESLRREGVKVATLGLSPLQNLPADSQHPLRVQTLRAVAATLRPFYNFRGMRQYKRKFAPSWWEPVYVAFRPDRLSPGLIFDIVNALMPGGVLGVAWGWVSRYLPFLQRRTAG